MICGKGGERALSPDQKGPLRPEPIACRSSPMSANASGPMRSGGVVGFLGSDLHCGFVSLPDNGS